MSTNSNCRNSSHGKTSESNNGSTQYQQEMLNGLGDRDYDSFDYWQSEDLEKKLGYALYGQPQAETGYNRKQNKKIKFIFNVILKQNNKISKWRNRVMISVVYNCTEPLSKNNPAADFCPIPVFILRKCKHAENPCRIFVDDLGRVYQTWREYLRENKLPKCVMVVPKDGRYEADQEGNVILERELSPANEIGEEILRGIDIAGAVGGIASGGVCVAAGAIAVAPVALATATAVGVGVGVYSIARSICSLVDRGKHKQTLSIANSEARGAYLHITAGSLAFVGAGVNTTLSLLVARGVSIGKGARNAVTVVNVVNVASGGVGVANAAYDVIDQCLNEQQPSMLVIIQLTSSILFFGHSVYSFRTAGQIIDETQVSTLKKYRDSLRSNANKKMFKKLLKETIGQNSGNAQKGRTEVISTLRQAPNVDNIFEFFSLNYEAMNKDGVRFAAKDGGITLNGVAVDINQMVNMRNAEVITFFSQLPEAPVPTKEQVQSIKTHLELQKKTDIGIKLTQLAFDLAKILGSTEQDTKEKVLNSSAKLLEFLSKEAQAYIMRELRRFFPYIDLFLMLCQVVRMFLQCLVNILEKEGHLQLTPTDADGRGMQLFKIICQNYFSGNSLNAEGWRRLLDFFYAWFAGEKMYFEQNQEGKKQRRKNQSPATKQKCAVCEGDFYKR